MPRCPICSPRLHSRATILHWCATRLEMDELADEPTAALVSEMRASWRTTRSVWRARCMARSSRLGCSQESAMGRVARAGAATSPLPGFRSTSRRFSATISSSRMRTTIVTSATLATDSSFEFLAARLGVDQPEIPPVTASIRSPFDYAIQCSACRFRRTYRRRTPMHRRISRQ